MFMALELFLPPAPPSLRRLEREHSPGRAVGRRWCTCRHSSARQSGSFVNFRSWDRSPLAAPHLLEDAAPAPPCDQSVSFYFLTSPKPVNPPGPDEENRVEHLR